MHMSEAVERMEKAFPKQTFIFNVDVHRSFYDFAEPDVSIRYSLSVFPEGKCEKCDICYGPSLENVVEQQLAKRYPPYLDEVDAALSVMPESVR